MGWKKTLIISVGILIGAAALIALIFSTEPEASRSGATKQTAMLVNVVEVEQGDFIPSITATGTVIPSQDIVLGSRVSGEILSLSEKFSPGSYVRKGEVLLSIDPSDYENNLQQAKSELSQAQADLKLEMGLQQAAKREYELLDDTLAPENKALVLREPQLETAKAQVEAAESSYKQAELDLQRTTIKAPFDAYILNRNVNIGSLVSPGQDLGRLVGVDHYWVETTVPISKLRWLSFDENSTGSDVIIRNRTAWDEDESRTGTLYRQLGSLENQTRMARVLVEVADPISIQNQNADKPKLIIGSFVETNIQTKPLENVVRLNRDYLRSDETAWVKQGDSLSIRNLEIEFQDAVYAYITAGLEGGEEVITTNLSSVTEGAALRLENSSNSGSE
ncbi:MAG: efflux transporter periplasmic adaptor subunit [Balneola sp.]|jgi:RND family efflux transporter MFP subunit|nr:efflux transporter periplasmic adaptor subunit [Balneola sp.]MBE77838.1 efflux transporter periplasmic adaptor subunit [Balneola sp.]HBX64910.1 efflux transporter periplasmic adaptor subunit [Balneolaceae bacterium]|tara:strand:+ start:9323 stop:10498 length:1176 start_codon:yes stop_codon:yes gene_type:complete